jgi:hypothetical protein
VRSSLVSQVSVTETGAGKLPILAGDCIEELSPNGVSSAGHDHDRVAKIEVADVTSIVEPPTMACC